MRTHTDLTVPNSLKIALLLVLGLLLAGASYATLAGDAEILASPDAAVTLGVDGIVDDVAAAGLGFDTLASGLDSLPAMAAIGLLALALTLGLRIGR